VIRWWDMTLRYIIAFQYNIFHLNILFHLKSLSHSQLPRRKWLRSLCRRPWYQRSVRIGSGKDIRKLRISFSKGPTMFRHYSCGCNWRKRCLQSGALSAVSNRSPYSFHGAIGCTRSSAVGTDTVTDDSTAGATLDGGSLATGNSSSSSNSNDITCPAHNATNR
jgi:hypothetical protein